jgi:hypothetical protein
LRPRGKRCRRNVSLFHHGLAALIREGEPKDSPAQWLFDWFTGENAAYYITNYTSSVPVDEEPILLKAKE